MNIPNQFPRTVFLNMENNLILITTCLHSTAQMLKKSHSPNIFLTRNALRASNGSVLLRARPLPSIAAVVPNSTQLFPFYLESQDEQLIFTYKGGQGGLRTNVIAEPKPNLNR